MNSPSTSRRSGDRFAWAATCWLAVLSAGCGESPTGDEDPVAATVVISPSSFTFTSLGASQQVDATVRDRVGRDMPGASVEWSVSPAGIATVSSTGLLTSVARGSASVTATSGSAFGSAPISVGPLLTSLLPSSVAVTLGGPGDTTRVSVRALDPGGTEIDGVTVTWSTGDVDVARIDPVGWVLAEAVGTTEITAEVTHGGATLTTVLDVTVETPPQLLATESCSDFPFYARAAFADPALEAEVRARLGLGPSGPMRCDRLRDLGVLPAASKGIASLVGAQNLVGLMELDLGFNAIVDLEPLTRLTALAELLLHENSLTDVGPLAGLSDLVFLSVSGNAISDIGPLGTLTGLLTLYIANNAITDVSALATLDALELLAVDRNPLDDLTTIGTITSLIDLNINTTGTTSVAALSGLTGLTRFTAADNSIVDITPMAAMSRLERVSLWDNDISDIGTLGSLTTLTSIGLSGNPLSDVGPLSTLSALEFVSLAETDLTDISALGGLSNLETVVLHLVPGLTDLQHLVTNPGIGSGDEVSVFGSPVSCSDVAALEAKGVDVTSDCGT